MLKIKEILNVLNQNGYEYDVNGPVVEATKFCSLKCIESSGLYYLVGDVEVEFHDSIIICDSCKSHYDSNNTYIVVEDPQLVFYKLMNHFLANPNASIHKTAIVSDKAIIGSNVSIGANAVIGNSIISDNVIIKENSVIHDDVLIGDNSIIAASSVIGADGVAWIWDQKNKTRVVQPQIGGVKIGKNVAVGSNVTIVRGSVNENTEIQEGTLIAHGSQIGHGVKIGCNVHIANNVAIAGNVELDERVFVGAGASIVSQIKVVKDVVIGAGAVISKDISTVGVTYIAMPARAIPSSNKRLKGVPEKLQEGE